MSTENGNIFFVVDIFEHRKSNLKLTGAYESVMTYALIVTSNNIAAIGIMNNPSQKTGDVNSNLSMPAKTAAIGIDGQKLL